MATAQIPPTFAALRSRSQDGQVSSALEQVSLHELSGGEVLLRALYSGINYKDCLSILGRARIISHFPRIAGIEVVGEVLDSSHAAFQPGAEVMVHGFQTGIDFDGGFSEIVRVPAAHVQPLPAGLSPLQAATLGVPGFTVALALERFEQFGVKPADGLVAVSGAGGAVGLMAIAILSKAGYQVAAITRRPSQADALRALGAAEVIDAGLAAQAPRALEKARFVAAIDNVGGGMLAWLLRSMQDSGCVASVGNAGGNAFDGSVLPFIMRRVQLFGVVANAPWAQRHRLWARLAGDLRPDFNALQAHVHQLPLDGLLAHAALQLQGATSGRALVSFAPGP